MPKVSRLYDLSIFFIAFARQRHVARSSMQDDVRSFGPAAANSQISYRPSHVSTADETKVDKEAPVEITSHLSRLHSHTVNAERGTPACDSDRQLSYRSLAISAYMQHASRERRESLERIALNPGGVTCRLLAAGPALIKAAITVIVILLGTLLTTGLGRGATSPPP